MLLLWCQPISLTKKLMLDLFWITEFIDQFLIPKTQDNRFVHIGDAQHTNSFFKHNMSHSLRYYFLLCGCRTTVKMAHHLRVQFPELLHRFRLVAEGRIVYSTYCDHCIRTQVHCMNSRPSYRSWRSDMYLQNLQYSISCLIFQWLDSHYGARLEIQNHPITVLMFVHQKNGRTVGQYPGFTILTIVYSIYRCDETVCKSNQPIYHMCKCDCNLLYNVVCKDTSWFYIDIIYY